MQILPFISIALAIYAIYIARNVQFKTIKFPRSFHFTLSEVNKMESVLNKARIQFYVLYLSGKRVFFDEDTFDNINISSKIDTNAKIGDKKELVCHSWGDALRFGYVTDVDNKEAEQGEELDINVLSLPQSSKNRKRIENYFKQSGWKIERALSLDDFRIIKDNLEIYITYIS